VVGLAVHAAPTQPSPARGGGKERARGWTGSGVVVAPDGLILTPAMSPARPAIQAPRVLP
jgi:hypothetical protein